MSRRHGRPHHHERPRQDAPRPGASTDVRAPGTTDAAPGTPSTATSPAATTPPAPTPSVEGHAAIAETPTPPSSPTDSAAQPGAAQLSASTGAAQPGPAQPGPIQHGPTNGAPGQPPRPSNGAPHDRPGQGGPPAIRMNGGDRGGPCTAPQLRRFIKSRPYVPMHELRRRFAIDGGDDDVSPVSLDQRTVFVGLPDREGQLLGELLRSGEIGYELSLDPRTPIVIGVYPMRPVPRS
jgi:hypothetical protein